MSLTHIKVRGAREHNLKGVDIDLPRDQVDRDYRAVGSRQIEPRVRHHLCRGAAALCGVAVGLCAAVPRNDAEARCRAYRRALSPAISIEQKTTSRNPRSTVATVTEIYDYMRLFWARVGIPYSPATGLPITAQTVSQMVDRVMALPEGTRAFLLAPAVQGRKGEYRKELAEWQRSGYTRVRIDGEFYPIEEAPALDKKYKHDIEVVVDRIVVKDGIQQRLAESFEAALKLADGLAFVDLADGTVAELVPSAFGEARATSGGCPSGEPRGDGARVAMPRCATVPEAAPKRRGEHERHRPPRQPHRLLRKIRLPGQRLHHRRNRAAAVLASTPRKARAPIATALASGRSSTRSLSSPTNISASRRARSCRGRNPTRPALIICRCCPASPRPTTSTSTPRGRICSPTRSSSSSTAPAGCRSNSPSRTGARNIRCARRSRASSATSTAACCKPTARGCARNCRKYQTSQPCETCHGARLKPEALSVKIAGVDIATPTKMSVGDALVWFGNVDQTLTNQQQQIAKAILKEINERLGFLNNVGLDYLNLDRTSGTLSGGESQRIRLASQIGSGLSGVLYVLDEPSIGLHQKDNDRLLATLRRLRDLGNTVIVVEHDEDAIRTADWVVDLGPGAGVHGGTVMAEGTLEHDPQGQDRSPPIISTAPAKSRSPRRGARATRRSSPSTTPAPTT